jgi:GTP-binding protein
VLVVDARRGLLDGDDAAAGLGRGMQRPVHVLLSKSDQLKRAEARTLLARSAARLLGRGSVQLFSARAGVGLDEARGTIDAWLGDARLKKRPR